MQIISPWSQFCPAGRQKSHMWPCSKLQLWIRKKPVFAQNMVDLAENRDMIKLCFAESGFVWRGKCFVGICYDTMTVPVETQHSSSFMFKCCQISCQKRSQLVWTFFKKKIFVALVYSNMKILHERTKWLHKWKYFVKERSSWQRVVSPSQENGF